MITMKEIDAARAAADNATEYLCGLEADASTGVVSPVRIERARDAKCDAEAIVERMLVEWWAQGCKEVVGGNLFDDDALPENKCNRHDDCAAADAKARAAGRLSAEHCHDSCCEDCFGA